MEQQGKQDKVIIEIRFQKIFNIEEDREIYSIEVKTGILGKKVENLKGFEREIISSKTYSYEIKQFENLYQVIEGIKEGIKCFENNELE